MRRDGWWGSGVNHRNLHRNLSGLRLLPVDWRRAGVALAACILGVTVFIALLDAALFRQSLPPDYIAAYTSPLMPRILLNCVSAALDEVKFRLLLMTALVMLLSWWRGKLSPAWFIIAILAVQLVNVWEIIIAFPFYGTLRYWAVGSVWGWLYWRHGWLAALTGHGATHLLLDPVLLWLLSPD
jgi:hypothetical protein